MDMLGRTVGQYQLLEVLSQGENTVYKGFQPSMNRYVAVKVLSQAQSGDETVAQQFQRDMQAIAGLEHPNLLTIYDYGQYEGLLYIVTRLIEGGNLKGKINLFYDLDAANQVVGGIANGLDYLHERGGVYGNLKPSNILIDTDGTPLLTDIGYSQGLDYSASESVYFSPEQLQGGVPDRRSDTYALGILLYEMLTGEAPTPNTVINPRAKRPDLPVEVEKVLLTAVAQSPEQRYQTAGDLSRALAAALPKPAVPPVVPVAAAMAAAAPELAPEPESKSVFGGCLWVLGGVVIAALGLIILLLIFNPKDSGGGGGNIIITIPTPPPAAPSVTATTNANIRSGPGEAYPVIGMLAAGQSAEAIGRSADGQWWVISVKAASGGQGWISGQTVNAANTDNLPVIEPPAVPTATPEATETPPPDIRPQPPKASINGTTNALVGQTVFFTAKNSWVAEGSHVSSLNWDFGDGTTASGVDVSHVYQSPGKYKVELVITDDKSLSDVATQNVTIDPLPEPPEPEDPPQAVISAPTEGEVGKPVRFDGSASQASGNITSYAWEFGDGESANAVSVDHTYQTTGKFNVILTVTDDNGLIGSSNFLISITPAAEQLPLGPALMPSSQHLQEQGVESLALAQ